MGSTKQGIPGRIGPPGLPVRLDHKRNYYLLMEIINNLGPSRDVWSTRSPWPIWKSW